MPRQRVKRLFAFFMVSVCLFMGCTSCQSGMTKHAYTSLDYFDTSCSVIAYCDDETFEGMRLLVEDTLLQYHQLFDIYHEYEGINNLATVNRLAGESVVVDADILDLLSVAVSFYETTDGAVNVAMGSVLSLWHDAYLDGGYIPADEDLQKAAEHTDITRMILDTETSTVTLLDAGMRLDVGAVAKGYVCSKLTDILKTAGYSHFTINLGGNVQACGGKRNGKAWRMGLENPLGERYLAIIKLKDGATATSGSYQRYFVVDGQKYHHIIDPDTLYPSNDYLSVTIVADDALICDALSTALFNMSVEDGKKVLCECPGASALWLLQDGTMIESDDWAY